VIAILARLLAHLSRGRPRERFRVQGAMNAAQRRALRDERARELLIYR
jgi:hypothetical protein